MASRSPLAQGLVLLLIAIGLVVIVPIALIAMIGAVVLLSARWARRRLLALRSPNGPLDGRRNVRVRLPEDAAEG